MSLISKYHELKANAKALLHSPSLLRYEVNRALLERNLCESDRMGITELPVAEREVVVSLTSYGRRVEQVHVTIESLMRQTVRPNRIVLWLDESFTLDTIPAALMLQQRRGLEVCFCRDLHSYKKLLPALEAFPEALIITADDDIVYDAGMVDRLLRAHRQLPGCIVTNSAFKLVSDTCYSAGHIDTSVMIPSVDLLPYGGNGTLYPPGTLHPDVEDWSAISSLCPTADDIWFKAMSLRAGTLVARVCTPRADGWNYVGNPEVQDMALWQSNVRSNCNDEQYAAVMARYHLSVTGQPQ